MKLKLLSVLAVAVLFLMPGVNFAQAPIVGSAASFVLFTTNGAMTCSGTKYLTHLTGNVGSNLAGSVTGFGNVDGVMHADDATTALCASDVVSLYTQLSTAIPTSTLASPFGGGDTLVAGVYDAVGAATLTGNLILNGQGNPNALFIFQVGGVLSTNALSKVILINGALACNVFWQVNGAIGMGTGTTMRGTIVANGEINMTSTLDTLEGRALAMNAAVLASQLVAYTPIGCGSPLLTGPVAPSMLDSTAAYGVFSSIGAVTGTPVTYVIGSVGANSTMPSGFNPLDVTGSINAMDPSTAAAAADLTNVYNYLVALPADIDLLDPADFGHGLVLTPHSYQVTGITNLTGNIILNAEGDANAVFVIKINGAFTTSTLSDIVLENGAQAKNVYWKVDGAVNIFSNSVFNGTIVAAGAITLNTGDTLNGRALTINGAIAINGSYVDITPVPCVAPAIDGAMSVCPGSTTILSDSTTGGRWLSSNTTIAIVDSVSGIVTGVTSGNSTIQYATAANCVSATTITVNVAPSAITGPGSVCVGNTIILIDTTAGGVWSSSNTLLATAGSASGVVTGVAGGTPTISYQMPGACAATKTITVNPATGAGIITGPSTVCAGSFIVLADSIVGGVWSSSNTNAVATDSLVTGVSTGIDTIMYTVTPMCGPTATATKVIAVNAATVPNSIIGASSVCVGSTVTLTDIATGGTWSSSNANASVSTAGVVTGSIAGTDTISYTVTNSCGTAPPATKTITINALPGAGSITGTTSVCVGMTTTLSDAVTGGTWSSSNTNATIGTTGVVMGTTAGNDVINYTVANANCSATATQAITINPLPNSGSITGASSVCVSATTPLGDAVTGGVWSSSNSDAAIGATGMVTGEAAGTDTISYTVTNGCGTALPATQTLAVNPLPNSGSITGASSVCVSATTPLGDATTGGVWSRSNTNAAVGTTGIVTGEIAGTDMITYTVANECGTAPPATKMITVNPLPNSGSITGASNVCVSAAITLTDVATDGVWNSSNINATAGTTGIVTGAIAGTDTISYTVTNSCGTAPAATQIITVNPLPNSGSITGTSSVCVNATTVLSDVATGGVWGSSNTNASVGSTGVVTGEVAGTDIINYTVSNGCGTAPAATETITINPLPDAGFITGTANTCVGSFTSLTDSIAGGVWTSSNGTATVVLGTVTGVSAGTDTIRYKTTNICGTATTAKTITVDVAPAAPVITTRPPSTACTGTLYQNIGTSTPPAAGTVYNWTAANAAVWAQGTGHQYALINFNEPGTAVVTLTASIPGFSCTSQSSVTVTVGASIAQSPEVSYFTSHFVCTPSNENSYQWGYDNVSTLDSTLLPGEINQDYLNTSPDFYNKDYWVLTTLGGCLQKTYYHTPTTVQNLNSGATGISVYPNPANSYINVVISAGVKGSIEVAVWNVLGQQVNTVMAADNKAVIDVSMLPAGSYLVTCNNDGIKIASARFVKN